jgi:hypothetical protein
MIDKSLAARTFQIHKLKATLIEEDVREIHSYLKNIMDEKQCKGYYINAVGIE